MRKAMIFTLLFLIVSVSTACWSAFHIYESRDDIVLVENTIMGDKAQAEGLTTTLTNTYRDRLFWNTTYTLYTTPETTYTYSAQELTYNEEYDYSGITLTSYPDFGMSEAICAPGYRTGMNLAGMELFNSLAPGEEKEAEIYLKDYYEYYPISVWIDFPNMNNYLGETFLVDESRMTPNTDHYVMVKLRDYFKIPISTEDCYRIQVSKDLDGNLGENGMLLISKDCFQMQSTSILMSDACYFLFDAHSFAGNLVDTSLLPDGFGIFCLPYEAYRKSSVPYDLFDIKVDELDMVYPLNPEIHILNFTTDTSNSHFLLHTLENEVHYLTIIDIKTMETVQKIELSGLSASDEYTLLQDAETKAILFWGHNTLGILALAETGQYQLEFICDIPFYPTDYFRSGYLDFSYNGTQLAVGWIDNYSEKPDFHVTIFDDTGLTYFGKYENSLHTYTPNDIPGLDYICRPYGESPLQITWTNHEN